MDGLALVTALVKGRKTSLDEINLTTVTTHCRSEQLNQCHSSRC